MISLEQIQKLEARVHAAVGRIKQLTEENTGLSEKLDSYERRVNELQELVAAFKSDQDAIERGIVAALAHLDELEDTVSEPIPSRPTQPVATTYTAPPESAAEITQSVEATGDPPDVDVDVPAGNDETDDSPEDTSLADPSRDDEDDSEGDEPDENPELDIF